MKSYRALASARVRGVAIAVCVLLGELELAKSQPTGRFRLQIQPVDATHHDPPRRKECCR